MEIRHLRYFVAVAEESSFTRAAERLWVAQPGLSAQIRRLEEELGLRLFERHSRGAILTPSGVLLLERARVALDAVDAVQELGRDLEIGRRGSLRVGICSCAAWSGTSRLLGTFGTDHPDVEITLVRSMGGLLVREVRDRRLDAAIVPGPFSTPELASTRLIGEPLAVGVPPGHPLAIDGPVEAIDLDGHNRSMLGHRDSSAFDRAIDTLLSELGVSTESRRRAIDPSMLGEAPSGDTMVVTTVASCEQSGLLTRELHPAQVMPFVLVHRDQESSAVLRELVGLADHDRMRPGHTSAPQSRVSFRAATDPGSAGDGHHPQRDLELAGSRGHRMAE